MFAVLSVLFLSIGSYAAYENVTTEQESTVLIWEQTGCEYVESDFIGKSE